VFRTCSTRSTGWSRTPQLCFALCGSSARKITISQAVGRRSGQLLEHRAKLRCVESHGSSYFEILGDTPLGRWLPAYTKRPQTTRHRRAEGVGRRLVVCLEPNPRRTDDGIEILPASEFVAELASGELLGDG